MFPAKVLGFARLSRLDSSSLGAMVIFLPLWLRGIPWAEGTKSAFPILTASVCGFVLNDIHDAERDAIIHSDRPIPLGLISKNAAMIFYFAALFATLISIKAFIANTELFLYLLFIIAMTNYNFLIERFPYLKNLYVAFVTIIPVLIVQQLLRRGFLWYPFPLALLLFILGREVLMDTMDSKGDGQTFAKVVGIKISTWLALSLQGIGLLVLLPASESVLQKVVFGILALLLLVFSILWTFPNLRRTVIHLMKAQLAVSIVYLID